MAADREAAVARVAVRSAGRFELGPATVDAFELETATFEVVCSSGDRETGEWRGVPVDALLERADPAEAATHLVVTGADGYRVCVPLAAGLEALLALERVDAPDDGSLPRFLGPAVEGTRSVKLVRRLETVSLGPDDDPEAYEELLLEDA